MYIALISSRPQTILKKYLRPCNLTQTNLMILSETDNKTHPSALSGNYTQIKSQYSWLRRPVTKCMQSSCFNEGKVFFVIDHINTIIPDP